MRKQYKAGIAQGLQNPFPDTMPVARDEYTETGQYMVKAEVIDIVNAMPSEAGYFSFFGAEYQLAPLPEDLKLQDIVAVRTKHGVQLLLALCSEGMYICAPGSQATAELTPGQSGTPPHHIGQALINLVDGGFNWLLASAAQVGVPSFWARWTHAVVQNRLLFYQAGLGYILEITSNNNKQVVLNKWSSANGSVKNARIARGSIASYIASDTFDGTLQTITLGGQTLTVSGLDKLHNLAKLPELWDAKLREAGIEVYDVE